MKKAFVIAKFELMQFFREPQFFISYFVVPMIMIGLYVFFTLYSGNSKAENELVSRMLIILVGVLVTGMSLTICADSFAGERERNTLEVLLCTPMSLRVLFWGKVLSVLPLTVLVGWAGQGVVMWLAFGRGLVDWGPLQIVLVYGLTPVSALFIVSVSIFISLKAQTVRSAAQISGLFVLLYLFLMQALSQLFFLRPVSAVLMLTAMAVSGLLIIYKSMRKFDNLIYTMK